MHADADRPVLTVRQVALALGLSEETVRRRCQVGTIPGAFRTRGRTGHWRVHRAVFQEWVDRLCPVGRRPSR